MGKTLVNFYSNFKDDLVMSDIEVKVEIEAPLSILFSAVHALDSVYHVSLTIVLLQRGSVPIEGYILL